MTSGYTPEQLASRAAATARFKETNPSYFKEYRTAHKEASEAYQAQHYATHKEAKALYGAQYRATHKEAIAQYNATRKEVRRAYKAQYCAAKRKNDPEYRVLCALRTRLNNALRGRNKSARTLALLGCPIEFFRGYIEKQFQPGWTWENYGTIWELDHILPCAEFHLQHSEEQEICFHWTNFQPLSVADNRTKGDKIL